MFVVYSSIKVATDTKHIVSDTLEQLWIYFIIV